MVEGRRADAGQPPWEDLPPAPQEELEGLIAHFRADAGAARLLFPRARAEASRRTLRNLLTKPGWNHLEVRTLRGVLSTIEKKKLPGD
jgi:tRNA/rRNA methyltransferase